MSSLNRAKNVVVFGSGTGTNLEALLNEQHRLADPPFQVKALFTDKPSRIIEIGERENIPVIYFPLKGFGSPDDPDRKLRYNEKILELIEECAEKNHFQIDLIVLAGYMRLVLSPIIEKYRNRMINVHPADLTVLDESGKRKYIGKDAVAMALKEGETKTRSTVIEVNEEVDGGRILTQGPWVEYTEGHPLTPEKAAKHQEKQKVESDWPALIRAVRLLSENQSIKEVATCVGL